MLNHKVNMSAPYTLQPPIETKPTNPPYKLLPQPLIFESKTMTAPYSLQRPIDAKSLHSSSNFPASGKVAMDENDFPQLPAATSVNAFGFKTHPPQQKGKSRNKKMLSVKIIDDPHISSKYIISPLATKKNGTNEAGSPECPAVDANAINNSPASSKGRMGEQTSIQLTDDNSAKNTKSLPDPLNSLTPLSPVTFQNKTKKWQTLAITNDTQNAQLPTPLKSSMNEHGDLQFPIDGSAKETISPLNNLGSFTPFTPPTPATPHKKTKKWQPLNIPLNTHARVTPPKQWLPAREYYNRRRGQTQNSVLTPPKSVTDSANLITPEKKPINNINFPQTPITNKDTPKSSAIPTSPSRKVTAMDPMCPINMPQESKKTHVPVKLSIKKYHNRGFLYKYPPRERPYYAMIQCRSEMVSQSSKNGDSCRYRSRCCFGHEEDRYFDSPWQVQRFVQGFNVDLWESRTELAGKQDLMRRREELMAIAEVVNRDGMKGGHRKLVEAERAKRGLKPQTDEWCWAGRTFRAKNGGSPNFLGKNWEDKTITGASVEESDLEVQTLTGSPASSQDDDNDTIGPNDGKNRLFTQHLRAETEAYKTRMAIAEQLREHERKLAREQKEFERKLQEQQQEFEREMHLKQVMFQKFYQEQKEQRQYQEQQRLYEAQRHMYNKPIMRPTPNSIRIYTAVAPTVPYNKPIARPTSIATSIPSQPPKSQNCFSSGLGDIPQNLCPQYAQCPRNGFQGATGEKWCYYKQFPVSFGANHDCCTVQSLGERLSFSRVTGQAEYYSRQASGQE